jgi:hypothetical protein
LGFFLFETEPSGNPAPEVLHGLAVLADNDVISMREAAVKNNLAVEKNDRIKEKLCSRNFINITYQCHFTC